MAPLGGEAVAREVVTKMQAKEFWKAVWEREGNYNPSHSALQNWATKARAEACRPKPIGVADRSRT